MTLVNPALGPFILAQGASKDSRWLTLEVCREFARSKCSRADEECKYAHPPPHVEIQNGRVTCCFDSIKGKCQRKDPPCKYLHPPQHLKELLLQNGRQNLIMKSIQMQTAALQPTAAVVQLPSVYPVMSPRGTVNNSYLMPTPLSYAYYKPPTVGNMPRIIPTYESGATFPFSIETNHMVGSLSGTSVASGPTNGLPHQLVDSTPSVNKQLERQMMEVMTTMGRKRPHEAAASVAVADDLFLGVNAMPGVVPVLKRPALVNPQGGLPIYRPCTTIYHSATPLTTLQLQQPTQFVSLTK